MKYKPKEASLRNLKPAQKGEVRNPEGARSHNPARRLSLELYREIIELALTGNIDSLKKVAEDPKTSVIQVGLAYALIKAVKDGDWDTQERITARILGKIPDHININSQNHTTLATIDEAKMKEVLKKLEEEV